MAQPTFAELAQATYNKLYQPDDFILKLAETSCYINIC